MSQKEIQDNGDYCRGGSPDDRNIKRFYDGFEGMNFEQVRPPYNHSVKNNYKKANVNNNSEDNKQEKN